MQRKREVPAVLALIFAASLFHLGVASAQPIPQLIPPVPLPLPAMDAGPRPPLAAPAVPAIVAEPKPAAVVPPAPEPPRPESAAPIPVPPSSPPAPAPLSGLERLRKAADLLVEVNAELGAPRSPYGDLIYDIAIRHSVNPHLVAALIHVESAFNPRAVSRKGAYGLMQLLPATARRFGLTRKKDLFNPGKNLDAGVRYLKWLTQRFGGDVQKILAAYNAGEGAVERFGGIPPYRETQQYVRRIFGLLGFAADEPANANPEAPVQAAAPQPSPEQATEPAGR